MEEQELRKLYEEFIEAWNNRDIEGVMALCADDLTFQDPLVSEPITGKDRIGVLMQRWWQAFPDIEIEVVGHVIGENRVAVEWRAKATNSGELPLTHGVTLPPTGKCIDSQGVSIIDFRDGKAVRQREYWDALAMMRQLGLLPSMPGTHERAA